MGELAFKAPRLPYHPAIEEKFKIDKGQWKALVEAIFPAAESVDSVVMALSYCKARGLDPMKRCVHIVPVWDSKRNKMVETVWPGIAELRTTAARTGEYAGKDAAEFGAEMSQSGVRFPEWAQVTVYRMVRGRRVAFAGPRVRWLEECATTKNGAPNTMWKKRPYGQIEKVAEAAALRCAFPEEIGNEYTAEEMEGRIVDAYASPENPETSPIAMLNKTISKKTEAQTIDAEPEAWGEAPDAIAEVLPPLDDEPVQEHAVQPKPIAIPKDNKGKPDHKRWCDEMREVMNMAPSLSVLQLSWRTNEAPRRAIALENKTLIDDLGKVYLRRETELKGA